MSRTPPIGDTPSLFEDPGRDRPLAARMRPRTLEEFEGQQHLLGAGKPLRQTLARGVLGSMILWGPPGSGKTTLARLLASAANLAFVPFSAVSEGVPRLRRIFEEAHERRARGGAGTLLFVDEIHRLNKAQQDSLLPAVEEGTVTLIGATTENPSFEINGALLSRARVFVLQPLDAGSVERIIRRALADPDRGVGMPGLAVEPDALALLAESADGDARRALTALEAAAALAGPEGTVTTDTVRDALQRRFPRYDKAGEEHFNMLSAYHKSLRGSDPQGALYWMARMIEGGEDPMTIFRRAIAMAAEDVGVADPAALPLAVAARDAYHMLGPPEGYLPLAEMTIYLATAPKSNSVKRALDAALGAARETPAAPVPLHIRNAPTKLMKELGYHAGYRYAHDDPAAYLPQEYLPDEVAGAVFYEPGPFGHEKRIAERLEWWAKLRRGDDAAAGDTSEPGGTGP
jgi:putative ATPase